MTPEEKWIAQVEFTYQVTEDEWRRKRLTLQLTRETTVEQIVAWAETNKADMGIIELLPTKLLNP